MSPSKRGSRFTEFRADGWPLCPACGEDELYSLAVPATVETITGCYRCPWTPGSDGCADCGKPKKSPEYQYCPECGQRHVLALFFEHMDKKP